MRKKTRTTIFDRPARTVPMRPGEGSFQNLSEGGTLSAKEPRLI